jgi:Fur family transcriptional regulator, ferric uptake regulator
MTIAHDVPQIAFDDVDGAAAALRRRGLRLSAARRLVLEALFAAARPVRAEELAAGVAGKVPPSDLASVYRNLETLERLGLVRHVHLGHGPGLYALAGRRYEYLVCERCGDFASVDARELDDVRALVRERFGYVARFTHFPIVGLCRVCSERHDHEEDHVTEHSHDEPHTHEHSHGDVTHAHPHESHEHEHTEHEHEHTHGDVTHAHPHTHEHDHEDDHSHEH